MIRDDGDGDRLIGANEAPTQLRLGLIALLIAGVFAIFVLRLFQLQILEGADLASRLNPAAAGRLIFVWARDLANLDVSIDGPRALVSSV